MKTITIKVPEELDARLTKRAKHRGVSKSEVAREALARELQSDSAEAVNEEPSAFDVLKDDLGCFDSGVGDLSTNPKHMEGFGR